MIFFGQNQSNAIEKLSEAGHVYPIFKEELERSKKMKKLFISCPMRGRKDEDIKKSFERMHRIAEAIFDEKLEVIDTFIQNDPPATKSIAVWYLGESIKKMANADYFIGIRNCWAYSGCSVERAVADYYDIPRFIVDLEYAAPDVENDDLWRSRVND